MLSVLVASDTPSKSDRGGAPNRFTIVGVMSAFEYPRFCLPSLAPSPSRSKMTNDDVSLGDWKP